jgi:hypothetical protein
MLGLALVTLLVGDAPQPADDEVHRGTGWYSAGTSIPEPPIALALVIVGAAGMRVRERRRRQREPAVQTCPGDQITPA